MTYEEVVSVHFALTQGEPWVRVRDDVIYITSHNSNTHRYNVCSYGRYTFRTQNMAKDSPNTRWVSADPDRRSITWIMLKQGGYFGKITQQDGHVEVYKFHPERKVYEIDL